VVGASVVAGAAVVATGASADVVAELAPPAHPARSTTTSEATILCTNKFAMLVDKAPNQRVKSLCSVKFPCLCHVPVSADLTAGLIESNPPARIYTWGLRCRLTHTQRWPSSWPPSLCLNTGRCFALVTCPREPIPTSVEGD
jgi:hypothetical protein